MSELKTLFFTGMRPAKGCWDIAHHTRQKIRDHLYPILIRAYAAGFNTFVSGLAQGFDQDAALCVIKLRLEMKGDIYLVGAIPFEGQEKPWRSKDKEIYNEIKFQCDSLVYVSEPGHANWKYQKRNEFMVDMGHEGICLWDGKPGGTANTIKYALSQGKRVKNLLNTPIGQPSKVSVTG